MKTVEELEAFMLKHGENIVDSLGAEVDRIEKILKVILLTMSLLLQENNLLIYRAIIVSRTKSQMVRSFFG